MKSLVVLILILILPKAYADCDSSQASADLGKSGAVSYSLGEKACTADQEQCFEQHMKDRDFCESPQVVVKYSCDKSVVKTEKKKCPENTKCSKGACVP